MVLTEQKINSTLYSRATFLLYVQLIHKCGTSKKNY